MLENVVLMGKQGNEAKISLRNIRGRFIGEREIIKVFLLREGLL